MASFADSHGLTLIAVLKADGWSEGKSKKKNVVLMVKKDNQSVNVNPGIVWGSERIESVCRNAGISAERFETLLHQIGVTDPAQPPPPVH